MIGAGGGLPHAHPINRLRRLGALLEFVAASPGCPAELAGDGTWLAEVVGAYDAAKGALTLDKAAGLSARWVSAEALARRDALLRTAANCFGDLHLSRIAEAIRREDARLSRRRGHIGDGPAALIAAAGKIRPVPTTARQIRTILEIKQPLSISAPSRNTDGESKEIK